MKIINLLPWIFGFIWALYGYLGSKGVVKNLPHSAGEESGARSGRAARLYPIMMAACLFFLFMEIFNLYALVKPG